MMLRGRFLWLGAGLVVGIAGMLCRDGAPQPVLANNDRHEDYIMATGPDEFLGAGSGFRVSFVPQSPGPAHAGISLIEEGQMGDGAWKPGRHLNGDENDQGRYWRFSKERIHVERSILYRWD